MKRLVVLSLLFISVSLFGQSTINFETVGQNWVFTVFANGPGGSDADYSVVANPSVSGINTSTNCGRLIVHPNADPWAGAFSTDLPDFVLTANNCIIKAMVYKNVLSNFNLKLEGPGTPPNHDVNVPNTVINQWQELTFDYSSDIGKTITTLTIIPDFTDPRNGVGSTNYFDNISFGGIVPVELTSFTAAFVGNNVELNWATASELNNMGFEIQRSVNNSDFITIAFIEGNGTTTEHQNYSFTDRKVESRINYSYRLKQIDFNGNYEYSQVINLGFTLPLQFTLEQNYPNPFNPNTSIVYSVPVKSEVTLEVYNLIGQKLVTLVQGVVEEGKHSAQLNASAMASGVYIFKISAIGENGSLFTSSKKMTLLK